MVSNRRNPYRSRKRAERSTCTHQTLAMKIPNGYRNGLKRRSSEECRFNGVTCLRLGIHESAVRFVAKGKGMPTDTSNSIWPDDDGGAFRRLHHRWYVDFKSNLKAAGVGMNCAVYDLSPGGVCVEPTVPRAIRAGDRIDFELPGYGMTNSSRRRRRDSVASRSRTSQRQGS